MYVDELHYMPYFCSWTCKRIKSFVPRLFYDIIIILMFVSLSLGIYGAMGLAGRFICSISGIDYTGGFDASLDAIVQGLGYAAPPIMALLFILDVWFIILLE